MAGGAGQWREQVAFGSVLAVLGAGFVALAVDPGRTGTSTLLITGALLLAAVLRAVLPGSRVGMLQVRGRVFDTGVYAVLGGVLLVLHLRLRS